MQVIWRRGISSVNDVQDALEQNLAYTTVQTMLNILCRKGKLKRKLKGRAYEYAPPSANPRLRAMPCETSSTACSAAPAKNWS